LTASTSAWSTLFDSLCVFPLHQILPGPECGCGKQGCTDVGKHPACFWSELGPGDKVRSPHHPHAGYGIATGERSGIFVVDCDGEDGLETFRALGPCPETFSVARGQGRHFYFRHPGFTVPNSRSALAPHVDIRGDGGYIVAPGSPHKSGDRYLVASAGTPVADAPGWLIDWLADAALRTAQPAGAGTTYEGDVTDPEELVYHEILYRDYLATAPPCVAKQGGDHQLWLVVQYGAYDLSLPTDVVLECIREVYDPRCEPPWGDELERRVRHKARCAKEHSTRPPNRPLPLVLVAALEGDGEDGEVDAQGAPDGVDAVDGAPDDAVVALEKEFKVTWGKWNETLPDPKYIVQDVIPDDTVGMIVAKGSSLKTWMALSLGIAVATGEQWLGRFEVEQGNVLIVDFESGSWQLRHRAQKLGAYDTPGLGHAAFPNGRIDDPRFWAKLAKLVKARNVRLVIVDSFAAGAPGVDENDAKAASPLNYAATLSNATGASVLFIHHAKKGEGGDERDLVRGTGAIYAALDWAVTMIPQDENRTRMLVRNIKPWGKRPDDFGLLLSDSGMLLPDVGPAKGDEGSEESESSLDARILAALARPAGSIGILRERVKRSNAVVGAHLKALVTARKVVYLEGIGYALDDDDKRLARVEEALSKKVCRSEAAVAAAATVDAGVVTEWVASGVIAYSAEGRFIFVGK
jgi:hypothetical protein